MLRAPLFGDRRDAGRQLAASLGEYAGRDDTVVIGLPRGGVPVAYEVARALDAPLDIFVVRKLGFPGREELAIGAIASGGVRVMNEDIVKRFGLSDRLVAAVVAEEQAELERRERELRGDLAPVPLAGRLAIVVDDGLATGVSMRAAVVALRAHDVRELVVAVPVASAEACALLRAEGDAVVCSHTPRHFRAVGVWYLDFEQTTDEEVRELLTESPRSGLG